MKDYKRVIIVDDNETAIFLNRDIVGEVFGGAEVISFTNSQEFIDRSFETPEWFSEQTLLLLDINMPGKFGYEVLDEMEDEIDDLGEMDVLMVTSSNLKRDIEVTSRFTCVIGYIVKPLTVEDLRNSVA